MIEQTEEQASYIKSQPMSNYEREYLKHLGIEDHINNLQQLRVFAEALKIYAERNKRYKDSWKDFGWRGMLHDIYKKTHRLWKAWWSGDEQDRGDYDDAIDLMNFSAFFIRAVKSNNEKGIMF